MFISKNFLKYEFVNKYYLMLLLINKLINQSQSVINGAEPIDASCRTNGLGSKGDMGLKGSRLMVLKV